MRRTRLRFVAEVNPAVPGWEAIPADQPLTFLPLEAVWPGRMDYSRLRPKAKVASGYTRFCEGDVIVPKITPTFQADRSTLIRGMPTAVGTGTTELHVIRPSSMVEPRYLDYLMSSRPFLLGGESWMIGVAGQKRVPDQWIRDFPILVTDPVKQRAIADYLDIETGRIGALSSKKRRMIELLDEYDLSLVDDYFEHASTDGLARLGYLAEVRSGVTLSGARPTTRDDVTVPYLRVANVQYDRLDLTEVKTVTVDRATARRTALRSGDVLMTEGGDIDKLGRGTVWRGEIAPCLHQNHVFAVRARTQDLLPDFLALVTRTSYARRYFEMTGVRSTNLASTNSSKVASFRIPFPDLSAQIKLVRSYRDRRRVLQRSRKAIDQQVALLHERRQALITGAVTGELSIPGAAA